MDERAVKIPYRENPIDPWDWRRVYQHQPAQAPHVNSYPSPPRGPSGLLGPDGRPLPPPPPFPFGFQLPMTRKDPHDADRP